MIEIAVDVIRETDAALLVNDGAVEEWVAKSLIDDQVEDKGKIISIFIPEWVAVQKGFL